MQAIADWLDVTFSPTSNPRAELRLFLGNLGFTCQDYSTFREVWFPPNARGALVSELKQNSFARVSASGGALQSLRDLYEFKNFLALLSDNPHRVTRLDAAYDVHRDAAAVLSDLSAKYPRELSLSRQRAMRCHYLLSARADGLRSGTMYVGHRSQARVTARVYDKALEALEKRGEYLPPTTRYEITFKREIASLWDALDPTPIFWAHASALLPVPGDAPAWTPDIGEGWSYSRPEVLPAVRMARTVSESSDLTMLLELADALGKEGRNSLMHLLAKRIGVEHKGHYFAKVS